MNLELAQKQTITPRKKLAITLPAMVSHLKLIFTILYILMANVNIQLVKMALLMTFFALSIKILRVKIR